MPSKPPTNREVSVTVSTPDEDGYCIVRTWIGDSQLGVHVIRCDMAQQWAAQELECLREYMG